MSSINEELNAVRKWLTAKDVYKRLQDENKTALFISTEGDRGMMIAGSINHSAILPVTQAFITAMCENLEDKDDRRIFKSMVTKMYLDELYDDYMKEKADESKSDNKR